jgi:tRNA(fMet)-specific endonuclease VapC
LKVLLDTNVCIALINGKSPIVEKRLLQELAAGAQLFVSSIAAFELRYGVARSSRQSANASRLEDFFAGPITLLPFDGEDARVAGEIRAALDAAGKPIGAYDVLIAGQALQHKLTLISANTKEFSRIKGLSWEDWAKG